MWQVQITDAYDGRARQLAFGDGSGSLSYSRVLALWSGHAENSSSFCDFFGTQLAALPFDAFLWETPALCQASAQQPFECLALDNPGLAAMAPDNKTFAAHFEPGAEIAGFANLGGDAWLIAPKDPAGRQSYPHMAAFCRNAPAERQGAFWQATGRAALDRLGARPLWISTNGLGVSWLHLRLDRSPKYYQHAPYRRLPPRT
ncbi:MAG: hypothetical protein AAF530_21410 [Pseudomonadota bacterium]